MNKAKRNAGYVLGVVFWLALLIWSPAVFAIILLMFYLGVRYERWRMRKTKLSVADALENVNDTLRRLEVELTRDDKTAE